MNNKIVIPVSGGMDSTTLMYMAAEKGYTNLRILSFFYGQRHKKELDNVRYHVSKLLQKYIDKKEYLSVHLNPIDISFMGKIASTSSLTNLEIDNPKISEMAGDAQPVSYVPFRNMIFLSICASYAESVAADTIWYGAAQIDSAAGYWDCDQNFIDSINNLISLNRQTQIKVEAPLLSMSKADIVREGVRLGVDFSKCWTCYSNRKDGLADATTPSSALRLKGFLEAGYKDPIQYVQQDKIEEQYIKFGCKDNY